MSVTASGRSVYCGVATGRWSISPAAMKDGLQLRKPCSAICHRPRRRMCSAATPRASTSQNAGEEHPDLFTRPGGQAADDVAFEENADENERRDGGRR